MKSLLKNLLGEHNVMRLKEMKTEWFPSALERKNKEQELEEEKKRCEFYGLFIKQGDLCFDVGANVGNRISPMLKIGAKVVAVEPQETCYKFLRSKFGNKIQIVTKGLGSSEGVKTFFVSNTSTISTFSEEWITSMKQGRFKGQEWNKEVSIQMTTLDKVIAEYGKPSFIKIDVEGYELEVLSGLNQAIKMISIEYAVPDHTDKLLSCIDRIAQNSTQIELNYSIGESMSFALDKWLSLDEMKAHVQSQAFSDTDFGDVYIRSI